MAAFVDMNGVVRAELFTPGEHSIGRGPLLKVSTSFPRSGIAL